MELREANQVFDVAEEETTELLSPSHRDNLQIESYFIRYAIQKEMINRNRCSASRRLLGQTAASHLTDFNLLNGNHQKDTTPCISMIHTSNANWPPSRKREEARALENLRKRVEQSKLYKADRETSAPFLSDNDHRVTRLDNRPKLLEKSRSISLNEKKQTNMEAKRKELMARGLPKQKPLKGVKQIVVVASGKGGVGKSTVAVNLSTALKIVEPKKSVGLLDADVFGPSVPLMMNLKNSPVVNDANLIEPLLNYGVKCMSMGFLIDDKSPVIWRGLMVMSAIEKLLRQVAWDPLDYLIVDTPPGTGDTHLSIVQNLPVTGALLVTTPQKAALEVTARGANMFKRLNVPIIGIVENMSNVICPKCNNKIMLYDNGTETFAQELGIQVLQTISLSQDIVKSCDIGKPVVLSTPQSTQAYAYRNLAEHVISFLANQPLNEE
ncbi:iron-sulfur cluster transfer protein NUBPL isoform X1 [Megachile rotundata]|uniref:iron-sulfur cluster transfer protein NUBPL isoform X1 n=1 Tax=Megachile rotundata TaxID=143995 RepID=UPI003FD5EB99